MARITGILLVALISEFAATAFHLLGSSNPAVVLHTVSGIAILSAMFQLAKTR